jgi:hypothetical protein
MRWGASVLCVLMLCSAQLALESKPAVTLNVTPRFGKEPAYVQFTVAVTEGLDTDAGYCMTLSDAYTHCEDVPGHRWQFVFKDVLAGRYDATFCVAQPNGHPAVCAIAQPVCISGPFASCVSEDDGSTPN